MKAPRIPNGWNTRSVFWQRGYQHGFTRLPIRSDTDVPEERQTYLAGYDAGRRERK